MSKARSVFRCTSCGGSSPKWAGRCSGCDEWNTLVEEHEGPRRGVQVSARLADAPLRLGEVTLDAHACRPTGIGELDRVLGGGLVPGSVTLVGGEPGVGKSTLLLQMAGAQAAAGQRVLYLSAEESKQQVRLRADRLGVSSDELWLASNTSLADIGSVITQIQPDVVVVDSIQTVHDPDLASAPGTVGQVRACAAALVGEAKERDIAMVLVGHVTKEGALAGPRVLEHMVDTVLAFEGDRHHSLRLVRAVKHRYGATDHLGVFEMGEVGLTAVADPSSLFLSDRREGVAGSVVVPIMDGYRPLLVEVQSLAVDSAIPAPRRSAQGLDSGRLGMLLAVLESTNVVSCAKTDVYALAVGGVKVADTGSDVAVTLAVLSSLTGIALPGDLVAIGEVGLAGELRQVRSIDRRLAEAQRLGFRRAIVPLNAPDPPDGLAVLRAATVADATRHAGLHLNQAPRPDPVITVQRILGDERMN